jgi:hypothetical protein
MLNSALNALKLHIKSLNFQKQKKHLKKNQVEGDIPLESFEGGLIPHPPLGETLVHAW